MGLKKRKASLVSDPLIGIEFTHSQTRNKVYKIEKCISEGTYLIAWDNPNGGRSNIDYSESLIKAFIKDKEWVVKTK